MQLQTHSQWNGSRLLLVGSKGVGKARQANNLSIPAQAGGQVFELFQIRHHQQEDNKAQLKHVWEHLRKLETHHHLKMR